MSPQIRNKKIMPNVVRGFTLIEMMVSVGIFALITTLIMVSGRSFGGSVLLTNLAYDVALSVRRAQTFGINVRADQGAVNPFDSGYGVRFRTDTPTEFLFYADRDGNQLITSGANPSEILETYTIGQGNRVAKACATISSVEYCSDSSSLVAVNTFFKRPDPDATIITNLGTASSAVITVTSAKGESREIHVESTGQISIQKP